MSALPAETDEYDYIIIGSGFGGSVSALRLSEKGYRVLVIEQGKRFRTEDFPRTNWSLRKFLWAPNLLLYGIQQISILKGLLVFHGAGVGGGSLVYANTLLVPPEPFFKDPKWADLADWRATLAPHYETAKHMLGVNETPRIFPGDEALRRVAERTGRGDTFHRTNVGVYFGEPGKTVKDPYFGGEGPDRTGCVFCGGCMVGCRFGAKNTLDKNYLWLAERRGTTILPETRVTDVRPAAGGAGGYEVATERSTSIFRRPRRVFRARRGVVFSAGVLGTVPLLAGCKERGSLPNLSDRLGTYVRTNSEALVGVTARGRGEIDHSRGIAIASGFYPDDRTHVEVVRYPRGSDFMGLLGTVATGGGPPWPRFLRWIGSIVTRPIQFLLSLNPIGWARRSIVLLVMQPLDNRIRLVRERRWWWPFSPTLASMPDAGEPAPTYLPQANAAAVAMAKELHGEPGSVLPEVVLNLSSTAHILGGCPIGHDPGDGVIDWRGRVFGHDGLYVVDGSAIPANLGVNPSLTITALAEHFMSHVPPKE